MTRMISQSVDNWVMNGEYWSEICRGVQMMKKSLIVW